MSAPSSLLDHIVIGKESTYNTAVIPSIQLPVAREGGISTEVSAEEKSELRSTMAKHNAVVFGPRNHTGSYKMDLFQELSGHVFLSALGEVTSGLVGGESAVYEHDFTETITKPSYTIEQKLGALTNRFSGGIFNTFKISAEAGTPTVVLDFDALAKSVASSTPLTPSTPTTTRFKYVEATVSIAGTAFDTTTKIEIEHNSGVSMTPALNNTHDQYGYVVDGSEVQITLELMLDATTASKYQVMLDGTDQRIDLDLLGGATIGTASNGALNIGVPNAKITAGETTQVGEGVALLPLTIRAYSETGSVYDTFKLINETSSY